jgi:phosphoribosyl 1,2-cyclic phosphodiesterase
MSTLVRKEAIEVAPNLWGPRAATAQSNLRETPVSLVVLASSSAGNCSALIVGSGGTRRVILLDAGLSPRRTNLLLADMGLTNNHIDAIVFTHLDSDHCYPSWAKFLPRHARFVMHARHRNRAERIGILSRNTTIFENDPVEIDGVATLAPILLSHDSLGVAVFRMEFASGRTLGFATDVGAPTPAMVHHLQGVDVLAIESNYCPRLQEDSDRPDYLKQRITGGSGHLSNEQTASLTRSIAPREHVVLLHLSRQCNTPDLAQRLHAEAPYDLSVAKHDNPLEPVQLAAVI